MVAAYGTSASRSGGPDDTAFSISASGRWNTPGHQMQRAVGVIRTPDERELDTVVRRVVTMLIRAYGTCEWAAPSPLPRGGDDTHPPARTDPALRHRRSRRPGDRHEPLRRDSLPSDQETSARSEGFEPPTF